MRTGADISAIWTSFAVLETSLEMSNALAEAPINDYDHYLSLQQIVFVKHGTTCWEHRSPKRKHKLDQGMTRAHGNCGYAPASLAKCLHVPKFDSVKIDY